MELNSQRLDLSLSLVFDTLMHECNLPRAAIRLHHSQPAVSSVFARLREQLDQPLLRRIAKGLGPTVAALALYVSVRQALHLLQAGLDSQGALDPHTTWTFRLTMDNYTQLRLLPGLVTRLRTLVPRVTLKVRPDEDASVPAQLADGELDLAIDCLYFNEPELTYRPVGEERLVVIGRQDHPAFRSGLDHTAYEAAQHVSILPQAGRDSPLEIVLGSARAQRRVQLLVPYYLTIPTTVASTELLGTMPRRLAEYFVDNHGLQLADVPFEMAPVQVNLIWHRQRGAAPGLQ